MYPAFAKIIYFLYLIALTIKYVNVQGLAKSSLSVGVQYFEPLRLKYPLQTEEEFIYDKGRDISIMCTVNEVATDFGCVPMDPGGFVGKFYGVGLSILGGVSVLFIIYGGYLYLTSRGNPVNVEKGKRYIVYAIIGLLLAIFGYVLIQVLVVDVLHIPGFK